MLPFALPTQAGGRPLRVLGVGAHPDDLEIGCAGTMGRLVRRPDSARVHWLVLTANAERADEARLAARTLLGSSAERIQVLGFPDGYLPAHWAEVKRAVAEVVVGAKADLVFCPARHDAHQDHRMLAEIVWQTARQTSILEYEIAKWEGDLLPPNMFVPLGEDEADAKIELLTRSFPSQHGKPWFDDAAFRALMRLRGIESGNQYAEAFHCSKLLLAV